MIGVIPMLGTTILLSCLVAWLLRLNQPAIQAAHWVVYPFQFVLLIPWYRAGEWLFNDPRLDVSLATVKAFYEQGWAFMFHELWTTTWHATVAWLIALPFVVGLLYLILLPLFRHLSIRFELH